MSGLVAVLNRMLITMLDDRSGFWRIWTRDSGRTPTPGILLRRLCTPSCSRVLHLVDSWTRGVVGSWARGLRGSSWTDEKTANSVPMLHCDESAAPSRLEPLRRDYVAMFRRKRAPGFLMREIMQHSGRLGWLNGCVGPASQARLSWRAFTPPSEPSEVRSKYNYPSPICGEVWKV